MVEFPGSEGLGHNHIHRATGLGQLLGQVLGLGEREGGEEERGGRGEEGRREGGGRELPPLRCEPRPGGWG